MIFVWLLCSYLIKYITKSKVEHCFILDVIIFWKFNKYWTNVDIWLPTKSIVGTWSNFESQVQSYGHFNARKGFITNHTMYVVESHIYQTTNYEGILPFNPQSGLSCTISALVITMVLICTKKKNINSTKKNIILRPPNRSNQMP